jgi:hypothetical protein
VEPTQFDRVYGCALHRKVPLDYRIIRVLLYHDIALLHSYFGIYRTLSDPAVYVYYQQDKIGMVVVV